MTCWGEIKQIENEMQYLYISQVLRRTLFGSLFPPATSREYFLYDVLPKITVDSRNENFLLISLEQELKKICLPCIMVKF